jgi:hypothetical protein
MVVPCSIPHFVGNLISIVFLDVLTRVRSLNCFNGTNMKANDIVFVSNSTRQVDSLAS